MGDATLRDDKEEGIGEMWRNTIRNIHTSLAKPLRGAYQETLGRTNTTMLGVIENTKHSGQ